MQDWPRARKMPDNTPFTALSKSASSNTNWGDLPPSSSVTRLRSAAAVAAMRLPLASEPVNVILATSGCSTKGAPISAPSPVTTLTTPGGKPAASSIAASSSVDADACSDGLSTTVLPAASAGASFHTASIKGEFQGVIATTTPSGSFRV